MGQDFTSAVTTAPIDSSWTDRAAAVVPAIVLAAWTFLVWSGRVRNVLVDEELSGSGRSLRVALALGFVALAVAVSVGLVRFVSLARARTFGLVLRLASGLALLGVVVWAIRGVDILIGSHEIGFKAIHTALAVVSIGLGAYVLRWATATR